MEKSGLAALADLVEGSGMFKLEEVLEGRVTEECLSLYNVDGSIRKTMKSKLFGSVQHRPSCSGTTKLHQHCRHGDDLAASHPYTR